MGLPFGVATGISVQDLLKQKLDQREDVNELRQRPATAEFYNWFRDENGGSNDYTTYIVRRVVFRSHSPYQAGIERSRAASLLL